MKKIVALLFLIISTNAFSWSMFGPKDYDECIFENMKGVDTDVGAQLIRKSCRDKFKEKVVDDSQKNRWTFFSSNDVGSHYYDKSTITRHGKVVTFEEIVDKNKLQSNMDKSFYSVILQTEIDCGHLTQRHLSLEFKSGHMGEGNTVHFEGPQEEVKITKEGWVYKLVCINQ